MKSSTVTLAPGVIRTIDAFPRCLKKGLCLSFSASFSSFSRLQIGKGYQTYMGDWIEIGPEYLYWHHTNENGDHIAGRRQHGLVLSGSLVFTLSVDSDSVCRLSLYSGGETYHCSFDWPYEMNGAAFVLSDSEMTDVSFHASSPDFFAPIWLFGDSYFEFNDRFIMGQLKEITPISPFLINAVPGQNSGDAYQELLRCLAFGTPRLLVWCLGMNDWNEVYHNTLEALAPLCREKGVELVLAVTPSVPERDKNYHKAEVLRIASAYGCRLLRVDLAVGADDKGNWTEGMLYDDLVHPTLAGAKAIAARYVADVPELLSGYSRSGCFLSDASDAETENG